MPVAWAVPMVLFSLGGVCTGLGQALLYEETFPHAGVGDISIRTAGWANDIPSQPNRLFPYGPVRRRGGVRLPEQRGGPDLHRVLHHDRTRPGRQWHALLPIGLDDYGGLTFSVDVRATYDPDNMASRFAVQINGTDWYASTSILPVPTIRETTFRPYAQAIEPAAPMDALSLLGSEVTGAACLRRPRR